MEFLLNFNAWFKALPVSGKLSFFLVIVGVVIGGFLLKSQYDHSGYQYLYTNLTISDQNAIAEKLQSMSVKVQMRGDSILVPGNRVLELRNSLASEGLPHGGGIGFEIFDQKNFGETEFQQRVNYVRAIQGELARTISAIDGVEKSRVHLVIPQKSLFAQDEQAPSASVAITMHKGRKLSDSQIRGVVHLVISSVEGLVESHISVIDQNGNILFKGPGDDQAGHGAKTLELQANAERRLERSVIEMIEKVVGPGAVIAKVSSTMNFQQVERTEESIDPESRTALSENITTETSKGSSGTSGGAPGAAANLGEGGAGSAGGNTEESKRVENATSYGISKTVKKIIEPVGTIQKLSAAVLVDGTYTTAEDGKETYTPRSADELKKIEELVRRAVGFDQARGDEVKIESMQFKKLDVVDVAQEAFVTATNSSRWSLFLLDNGLMIGVVLIVGIIFFLLVKLVNSYAPPINVAYASIIGQSAGEVAAALPANAQVQIISRKDQQAREKQEQLAEQIPEALQSRNTAGEINFVESANKSITVEAPVTSEEKLRLKAAKLQVEAIVKSNPDEAVGIIRSWLSEG